MHWLLFLLWGFSVIYWPAIETFFMLLGLHAVYWPWFFSSLKLIFFLLLSGGNLILFLFLYFSIFQSWWFLKWFSLHMRFLWPAELQVVLLLLDKTLDAIKSWILLEFVLSWEELVYAEETMGIVQAGTVSWLIGVIIRVVVCVLTAFLYSKLLFFHDFFALLDLSPFFIIW